MKNLDISEFSVQIKIKSGKFSYNIVGLTSLNGIVQRQKSIKFECRSIENKHEN